MTTKLQKNYMKRYEHTIKLDNEMWEDIKAFFMENYSEYSIILTMEDESTKKCIDFDSAKDLIIEEDDNIRKIRLFAQAGDEAIKIDYVNGMWTKQPAIFSEAKHVNKNYSIVNEFNKKLRDKSKSPI